MQKREQRKRSASLTDQNHTKLTSIMYRAELKEQEQQLFVKQQLQETQFKNRELQLLKEIGIHQNIIELKHYFYTCGQTNTEETYLNLIQENLPTNLQLIINSFKRNKLYEFPNILIKLYTYQILRGLSYLQSLSIIHRDINPQNVLIDPQTHQLKICNFESAKKVSKGVNSNIFSPANLFYYRAPEIILGSNSYNTSIDIWSLGCILYEIICGQILFKGNSNLFMFIEIIKILGTPTPEEVQQMNPYNKTLKYQPLSKIPFEDIFKEKNVKFCKQQIDLLEKMLIYDPNQRIKPIDALQHEYFDELRTQNCRINGKKLPELFDFREEEFNRCEDKTKSKNKLIPKWYLIQKYEDQVRNNEY